MRTTVTLRALISFGAILFSSASLHGQITNPANGHSYARVPEAWHFGNARRVAQIVGARLVSVNDAAEESWLRATFGTAINAWIGLSDDWTPGTFHWDSGEPLSFEIWAPGEPIATGHYGYWSNQWSAVPRWAETSRACLIESTGLLLAPVEGVACERLGGDVRVTWSAAGYESYRVYRDLTQVAEFPSTVSEYLEIDASPCYHSYTVVGLLGTAASVPRTCAVLPATTSNCMRMMAPPVRPADTVVADVFIDANSGHVLGYSLGVCLDTALADVLSVVEAQSANFGGSDFFQTTLLAGGFTVGTVFGFGFSAFTSDNFLVIHATIQTLVTEPGAVSLEFCDSLGSPSVATVVVVGGQSTIPIKEGVDIQIVAPRFRRGDVDLDGLLNLADPVFLISALFEAGSAAPECPDGADANDDGQLNLADPIWLLNYLFVTSSAPPAPPYSNCGEDPTPDGLECVLLGPC